MIKLLRLVGTGTDNQSQEIKDNNNAKQSWTDTTKEYWHTATNFVCDHYVICSIAFVVIAAGSIIVGKWIINKRNKDQPDKDPLKENKQFNIIMNIPITAVVKFYTVSAQCLEKIRDMKFINEQYYYSDVERQLAIAELERRKLIHFQFPVFQPVSMDYYSSYSNFDLLARIYLRSTLEEKAVIFFILRCRLMIYCRQNNLKFVE